MLSPKPREQLRSDSLAAAMKEVRKIKMHRLNADVPLDIYRRFKSRAALEGLSVTDIVNLWVNEYLSDEDGSN